MRAALFVMRLKYLEIRIIQIVMIIKTNVYYVHRGQLDFIKDCNYKIKQEK